MRYNYLILILPLLLIISSCNSDTVNITTRIGKESTHAESEHQKSSVATLELYKNEYLRGEFVEVELRNNSNSHLEYGSNYGIEVFKENKWMEVSLENLDFTLGLVSLAPKEEVTFRFELDFLEPGKYRLIKEVFMEDKQVYLITDSFNIR